MEATDRYYVKGAKSCKTVGLPHSKAEKDMEWFYTYPKIGHYSREDDARTALEQLADRFPGSLFFVERVPGTFDGVSTPGL